MTSEVPLDAIGIGERFEPEMYSYSVEAQRKVARAFVCTRAFRARDITRNTLVSLFPV